MTKRQKTAPPETVAEESISPQTLKERTPLLPDTSSPSAKGLASSNQRQKKKRASIPAKPTSDRRVSATDLQLSSPPEGGLRDIGELTFGRRVDTSPPPDPGAEVAGAANPSQRSRVPNVGDQPWRRICDLLITARDGTRHTGTGWFISPRTLITAGHCVFVFNPGTPAHGFVRSILVMPARNGEMSAAQSLFGWAVAPEGSFEVHPQWRTNRDEDFDYGAIVLPPETPLGAQSGIFSYGHFLQLDETTPFLSGYPDNAPDGTQWFERNLIKDVTPRRVFYDIFTFAGMSGSPLFFDTQQGIVVCAIHNFGDVPHNSGVRINPEVVAQLDAWMV